MEKPRITVNEFVEKLLNMSPDARERHLRSLRSRLSEQQYTSVIRTLSDMSRTRKAAPRQTKPVDPLKDAWELYPLSEKLIAKLVAKRLQPSQVRHMSDEDLRTTLPHFGPASVASLRASMCSVDDKK